MKNMTITLFTIFFLGIHGIGAFSVSAEAKTALEQTISPEFAIEISDDSKLMVGAAFDGINYLVIWLTNDGQSCRARLLSQSGENGPAIEIFNNISGGFPHVAFDGENYLVIWIVNNNIYGQFVSKSGTLINPPFVINLIHGCKDIGGIYFDGTNYMIIWTSEQNENLDIYSQIVSPSGTPIGAEIPISTASFNQKDSAIAFDGTNFLVVWNDGRRLGAGFGEDIYGQFVSKSGTLIGSNFIINQNDYPSDNPLDIAFDGTNYLVTWTDEVGGVSSKEWDIFGQLITTSGNLSGTVIPITTAEGNQSFPSIAFDGETYLVVWTDMSNDKNKNGYYDPGEGTGADIYGQFVDKSGDLAGNVFAITTEANDQIFGGCNFGDIKYFVSWTDNRSGTHNIQESIPLGDIYGVFITINGEVGVEQENNSTYPLSFYLSQNYPNPFNPVTTIFYRLPVSSKINIKVYDSIGHEIATLVDEFKEAGKYSIIWNAGDMPSGIYFCTMRSNKFTETRKIMLLR